MVGKAEAQMTTRESDNTIFDDGELEAAGYMYDALVKDGWEAWKKRNDAAIDWMRQYHRATPNERLAMSRDQFQV